MRHIEKAWALAEIDAEMAAFRAITAEEEAATAVFHSLRRHRYPGSQKLNSRSHLHKNALWPFVEAVAELFAQADKELGLRPRIIVNAEGAKTKLELWWDISKVSSQEGLAAAPQPPLNFSVTQESGALHDFGSQLDAVAKTKQRDSILVYLKHRANMRNRILYATAQGMPTVTALNAFLPHQRLVVRGLITLFLLIDPYPQQQLFARQATLAFLKMLDVLPGDVGFN